MKKEEETKKKEDWEILNKKIKEFNIPAEEKDKLKQDLLHKEAEFLRQTRKKVNVRDFEPLSIIGRGAFGEVRICREKSTGDIVAVKKMRKEDMFQKNQIMHVRTERDILSIANTRWVVGLRYSFQVSYTNYIYIFIFGRMRVTYT